MGENEEQQETLRERLEALATEVYLDSTSKKNKQATFVAHLETLRNV